MPRVDFYVLPENSQRERFACFMTSKARQQGNTIYIHTASREVAEFLDDLLWTFKDISFLPHAIAEEDITCNEPVIIGWQDKSPDQYQVMINLTQDVPVFAERFARIIEIVAGKNTDRQQARNRYRDYRDRGYELHNHTMESDYDNA